MQIDYRRYSKEDIERMIRMAAQMALIGRIYFGKIEDDAEIRWLPDGGCEVLTKHTPAPPPVADFGPSKARRKRRYRKRVR